MWLVSDLTKVACALVMGVFVVKSLLAKMKSPNREKLIDVIRLHWVTLFLIAVETIQYSTMHFGAPWEFTAVVSAFLLLISSDLGIYISYRMSGALYATLNLTYGVPEWMKNSYLIFAALSSCGITAATINILVTGERDLDILKYGSVAVAITVAGSLMVYTFFRLRLMCLTLLDKDTQRSYRGSMSQDRSPSVSEARNPDPKVEGINISKPNVKDDSGERSSLLVPRRRGNSVTVVQRGKQRAFRKMTYAMFFVGLLLFYINFAMILACFEVKKNERYAESIDRENKSYSVGQDISFYWASVAMLAFYSYWCCS